MRAAPRIFGSMAITAVLALLTGCTPALDYGVRLNADNTVDYVVCYSGGSSLNVRVDYTVPGESNPLEWEGELISPSDHRSVVHYGDERYSSIILAPPPEGWTTVSVESREVRRDELELGHWVWFTQALPFVPDQPCEGLTAEELAE